MVTFDKGARVPRIEVGTHLDARQLGILVAKAKPAIGAMPGDVVVRIIAPEGGLPDRLADMIADKGDDHPQVSLLALGMGELRRLDITIVGQDSFRLEGTRADGYEVLPAV